MIGKLSVLTAVVGLVFAAGCDCACKKNVCVPPSYLREEMKVNVSDASCPAVAASAEPDYRAETSNLF